MITPFKNYIGGGGGTEKIFEMFQRKMFCVVCPKATKNAWWNTGFSVLHQGISVEYLQYLVLQNVPLCTGPGQLSSV